MPATPNAALGSKNFFASRWRRYILGAFVATLFSLLAWRVQWRWGAMLDNAAHDVAFRLRTPLSPQDVAEKLPNTKDIVLIDIPADTPRSILADLVKHLHGARAVVLDIMLADRASLLSEYAQPLFEEKGEVARWKRDDGALARAMRQSRNVVIGIWPDLTPDGTLRWTRPSSQFVQSARALAHFRVVPDPEDGYIRRVKLWENDGVIAASARPGGSGTVIISGSGAVTPTPTPVVEPRQLAPIPAIALATAALKQGKVPAELVSPSANGEMWINYLGPRDVWEFGTQNVSLDAALDNDPSEFNGKLVFVGQTSFRSKDVFPTPTGDMPGLYIHAQATATLLDARGLPRELPVWVVALLSLSASLLVVASLLRFAPGTCALIALGEGLVITLVVLWLWAGWNIVAPLSVPALAIILTYNGIVLSDNAYTRDIIGRLVGRTMRHRLLDARRDPALGGKEEVATALFCDLRGFTTWAQSRSPQQLIADLNSYTATVVQTVEQFQGRPIDFFGDGVFVLFEGPGHGCRAVQAALALSQCLGDGGSTGLRVGVAVHSGTMVIGLVGHANHFKPGAVGDAVNIAARLQSFSDDFGCAVLLTRQTLEHCREECVVPQSLPFPGPILCGVRPIKGYAEELEIWGLNPTVSGNQLKDTLTGVKKTT